MFVAKMFPLTFCVSFVIDVIFIVLWLSNSKVKFCSAFRTGFIFLFIRLRALLLSSARLAERSLLSIRGLRDKIFETKEKKNRSCEKVPPV